MAAAVSRKSTTPRVGGAGHEARVVVQHRRHDAGGAVGRRGDDAAAGGVFLVDRQRVQVDPVEHLQRVAQRRARGCAVSVARCSAAARGA